ncbi:hypothetical protein LP420_07015 [Massilia sp. B-10]|nr:hypothetical protein LP420_07015 [Massilia sp. B-10]
MSAALPASSAAVSWQNWSGIAQCRPRLLAEPADAAAVAALLKGSDGQVRCVGASHSFTALVPTDGTLLSLDRIAYLTTYNKTTLSATLHGGTRLAQVSGQLDAA